MKSRGPKTEPCGIPQLRGHDWDDAFDVLMEKEQVDSLLSNMLWSMLSEAAEISRRQRQETC